MRKFFLITILCFWGSVLGQSGDFTWESQTSKNDITSCCREESILWFGTTGGLLTLHTESGNFTSFTNTDGLAENDVTTVTPEGNDVWAGFRNGKIQKVDESGNIIETIEDFSGYQIYKILRSGDSLWVAHQIGISLFLMTKNEVKETYRQLGRSVPRDLPVRDMLIYSGSIWAATDAGISMADLTVTNLLDPEKWRTFSSSDGLAGTSVSSLEQYGDYIYAATTAGVSRYSTIWETVLTASVNTLAATPWGLIAGGESKLFSFSSGQWIVLTETETPVQCLLLFDNTIYAGTATGIIRYENDTSVRLHPNCIGGKLISDITLNTEGELWCSTRDNGFYHFANGLWTGYTNAAISEMRYLDQYTIFSDSRQSLWIGGWGNGLLRLKPDQEIQAFYPENGYLSGIPNDSRYAVITDIAEDENNTLWFLNYYAASQKPLAAFTAEGEWLYFGTTDGIFTTFVRCLLVDEYGRKWIGTDYDGILIYDDRGTPGDLSDDPGVITLDTGDGLLSNEITALTKGTDGTIWIGTPKGLNYIFDQTVQELYGVPVENITSLLVDGSNNIWAGSKNGLNYFNSGKYSWNLFTKSNSELVDDHITNLGMDYESGILYIGTNKGLSLLQTPFSSPRTIMDKINAYPNPFIPGLEPELIIDELSGDVSVSIYTASGFLVKYFDQNSVHGRQLIWDGRSDQGVDAASGVYLIVAVNSEGKTQTGKFALIR